MTTIAMRLQKYLENKNWSQADFVKATGLDQSTVSQLINGQIKSPGAAKLSFIVMRTDINARYLLTGQGHPIAQGNELTIGNLQVKIDSLEKENKRLEEKVQKLEKRNEFLQDKLMKRTF